MPSPAGGHRGGVARKRWWEMMFSRCPGKREGYLWNRKKNGWLSSGTSCKPVEKAVTVLNLRTGSFVEIFIRHGRWSSKPLVPLFVRKVVLLCSFLKVLLPISGERSLQKLLTGTDFRTGRGPGTNWIRLAWDGRVSARRQLIASQNQLFRELDWCAVRDTSDGRGKIFSNLQHMLALIGPDLRFARDVTVRGAIAGCLRF